MQKIVDFVWASMCITSLTFRHKCCNVRSDAGCPANAALEGSMRKFFGIGMLAFILLAGQAVAAQEHVVLGPEQKGGEPQYFYDQIRTFRTDKVRVVIKGACLSSCTLYTVLVSDGLICARPGATFVFHRVMVADQLQIDAQGIIRSYRLVGPLVGPEAGRFWMTYPFEVRHRIMQESPTGLPRWGEELTIPATELVPTC